MGPAPAHRARQRRVGHAGGRYPGHCCGRGAAAVVRCVLQLMLLVVSAIAAGIAVVTALPVPGAMGSPMLRMLWILLLLSPLPADPQASAVTTIFSCTTVLYRHATPMMTCPSSPVGGWVVLPPPLAGCCYSPCKCEGPPFSVLTPALPAALLGPLPTLPDIESAVDWWLDAYLPLGALSPQRLTAIINAAYTAAEEQDSAALAAEQVLRAVPEAEADVIRAELARIKLSGALPGLRGWVVGQYR